MFIITLVCLTTCNYWTMSVWERWGYYVICITCVYWLLIFLGIPVNMKGLDDLIIFGLFLICHQLSCAEDCTSGGLGFNSLVNESDYVIGYPIICINGVYAPLCDQSLGILDVRIFCQGLQIYSKEVMAEVSVTFIIMCCW